MTYKKDLLREIIFQQISEERDRQDKLHTYFPERSRIAILAEGVGEVAKAYLEDDGLREELIQVAAVAVRWLEHLAREE